MAEETQSVRLTEMVACAGCAAKLGPAFLHGAVKDLFAGMSRDPNVLVGFDTLDDAGVYKLSDRQALVQTVDFFTPVVDDPFTFGEIAIANALSDVYAMGGRPITALNMVCFPSTADPDILHEVLRGGLAKFAEAGVALLGGHSIDDPEIKYGAAITGLIDPQKIITNARAQLGDILVLTKPLGIGIITTAIKQAKAPKEAMDAAITAMRTLNHAASAAAQRVGVHAGTDVTGFSLMGHLTQLCQASAVTARIAAKSVPLLAGALALSAGGIGPGGLDRNRAYFGERVAINLGVPEPLARILFDPQTSGGLLLAVDPARVDQLLATLKDEGAGGTVIGEITEQSEGRVIVT
ncbi:MAG TPA: selenide, water dikinase SelD [Capsulimonadaceae bacterium]|nr:selenide, water dikinase SelD [Capsulimonadaceae bacterium]